MSQPVETEKKTEKELVAHLMVQAGGQWLTICGWTFAGAATVEFMITPYGYDGEIRPCKDCQGKIEDFPTWRVKA